MSTAFLILRALLFIVSFVGLSALLSTRLRLDRFIAPCVAASGVIAVLMLAGMVGLLFPAVCALYALGFIGAVDALLHKHFPDWRLMLALGGFIIFLVWRFYFCPLREIDDFTHWGLAARQLLRYDRFPASGDDVILFQSYPLGAACWIYYVGRFIENSEGIYLVAQNFLLGLLFLPVFGLIQKKRKVLYPICAALFFLMFHHFRAMIYLQVDLVLSFFGIGIAAAIVYYRHDLRRALGCALPGMVAVTFIKNSGLFFAFTSAALLLYAFHGRPVRHRGLLTLAALLTPVLAFLLWELHTKLAFPDAQTSKHAVSVGAYLQETLAKGGGVIARIAKNQFSYLFRINDEKIIALAVLLPATLMLFLAARRLPHQRARRFRTAWLCALGMYLVWYLLVFLMYVFTMSRYEALHLICMYRYNGTGLSYLMGLTAILLIVAYQQVNLLPRLALWVSRLSPLLIAAMIALTAWPGGAKLNRMFERDTRLIPERAALQAMQRECGIEDGDRVMAFVAARGNYVFYRGKVYHYIKYEYGTDDIFTLFHDDAAVPQYYALADRDSFPADMTYDGARIIEDGIALRDIEISDHIYMPLADPSAFIAEKLDNIDALLILGDDADFESIISPLLAERGGDIPVYRAPLATLS